MAVARLVYCPVKFDFQYILDLHQLDIQTRYSGHCIVDECVTANL